MKTQIKIVAAAILATGLFGFSSKVQAGATTSQTVSYEVQAINELAVSGDPSALTINAATAGSGPTTVTDTTSTYSVTTNESSRKITGHLNSDMDSGVTLSVTLAAPSGATSAGKTALSHTDSDLVTGISTTATSGLGISYELAATVDAGVVSSKNKTVTFTITAG